MPLGRVDDCGCSGLARQAGVEWPSARSGIVKTVKVARLPKASHPFEFPSSLFFQYNTDLLLWPPDVAICTPYQWASISAGIMHSRVATLDVRELASGVACQGLSGESPMH
eukprot:scaffold30599_cov36-Prasinocladus_malaysianus.AAC.1